MSDAPLPPPPSAPAGPQPGDDAPMGAPDVRWAPPFVASERRARSGQLTTAWQIMVAATWAAAFFAFAGVWKASEEVGIATWWLGPRADPQPIMVRVIPFVIALATGLCAVYNARFVAWASLAGTVAYAVIATVDLSYMTGLAIAEFVIAGGVGLVTLAAFGGRYRSPTETDAGSAPPLPVEPPTAG